MILEITSKKYGKFKVFVDDDKKDLILEHTWCASVESKDSLNKLVYVVGWKPPRKKGEALIRLHRLIIGALEGEVVDHINGDTLDNRLSNLRIVDHATNMQNTRKRKSGSSKYKGVDFRKGIWRARIYKDGSAVCLGYFSTEEEAAKAYNSAIDKFNTASPKNIV